LCCEAWGRRQRPGCIAEPQKWAGQAPHGRLTVRRGPALVDLLSAAHVASAAVRTASSPGAGAPPPLVAAGPSRTTPWTYSLMRPVKSWGPRAGARMCMHRAMAFFSCACAWRVSACTHVHKLNVCFVRLCVLCVRARACGLAGLSASVYCTVKREGCGSKMLGGKIPAAGTPTLVALPPWLCRNLDASAAHGQVPRRRTLLGGMEAATSVNSSQARARLAGRGLPRVWRTSCMYNSSRSSGRFRPWGRRGRGAAGVRALERGVHDMRCDPRAATCLGSANQAAARAFHHSLHVMSSLL
jgi:hypothetical protein